MTRGEQLAPLGSAPGGLCWYGDQLLVSLPREARIAAFEPSGLLAGVFRRFTGSITAMAPAADGRLYCCQPRSRRVVCLEPDGSATVPAERLDGRVHNHPAGIAVDGAGEVWFSDPVRPGAPPGFFPFLEHASVLCLSPAADPPELARATWDTKNPGPVAVDVEHAILYVIEGVAAGVAAGTPAGAAPGEAAYSELRAYPIQGPGRLGQPATFTSLHAGELRRGTAVAVSGGGTVLLAASAPAGDVAALYTFSSSGQLRGRTTLPGAAVGVTATYDAPATVLVVTEEGLWRLALEH